MSLQRIPLRNKINGGTSKSLENCGSFFYKRHGVLRTCNLFKNDSTLFSVQIFENFVPKDNVNLSWRLSSLFISRLWPRFLSRIHFLLEATFVFVQSTVQKIQQMFSRAQTSEDYMLLRTMWIFVSSFVFFETIALLLIGNFICW